MAGDNRNGVEEGWLGWASAACAVHCVGSPVLAVAVPLAAFGEQVERGVLGGMLLLAGWLLRQGVRRHGNWLPGLPVAGALLLWGAALGGLVDGAGQAVLIGAGGLLSYAGLKWSRSFGGSCSG
jgi:hypothetical protein